MGCYRGQEGQAKVWAAFLKTQLCRQGCYWTHWEQGLGESRQNTSALRVWAAEVKCISHALHPRAVGCSPGSRDDPTQDRVISAGSHGEAWGSYSLIFDPPLAHCGSENGTPDSTKAFAQAPGMCQGSKPCQLWGWAYSSAGKEWLPSMGKALGSDTNTWKGESEIQGPSQLHKFKPRLL